MHNFFYHVLFFLGSSKVLITEYDADLLPDPLDHVLILILITALVVFRSLDLEQMPIAESDQFDEGKSSSGAGEEVSEEVEGLDETERGLDGIRSGHEQLALDVDAIRGRRRHLNKDDPGFGLLHNLV